MFGLPLFNCCRCNCQTDLEFEVTPWASDFVASKSAISRMDSLDITFAFRDGTLSANARVPKTMTPRQRSVRSQLTLPILNPCPLPPGCSPDEDEETRRRKLLQMYQDFAADLHTGMFLSLSAGAEKTEIHCQLMDDLHTFKMDPNNGRIIEFPLSKVSKVYRMALHPEGAAKAKAAPQAGSEHNVVMHFDNRKLAFVFKDGDASQRFLLGMELLIRQSKPLGKSAACSDVSDQTQGPGESPTTPRVVHAAAGARLEERRRATLVPALSTKVGI